MRSRTRAVLIALAAAALLAGAVGGASARSFSWSVQSMRVTWRSLEFESAFVTIRCPVTLEGSFAGRTFPKVLRTLLARIGVQRINEAACTGGRASIPPGTWHVTYEGFTGRLPNITSIPLLMRSIRIRVITALCTAEYGTEADNPTLSAAVEAGGSLTTLTPVEGRNRLTLFRSESGICPEEGIVAGTGEMTGPGGVPPRIRITLI